MNFKTLVVDPDLVDRDLCCKLLKARGHEVFQAPNSERALEVIQEQSPELVVTEYSIPRFSGQALVDRVKKQKASAGVLILHRKAPDDILVNLMRFERTLVLQKPIQDEPFNQAMHYLEKNRPAYDGSENRKYRRIPCAYAAEITGHGFVRVDNLSAGGAFVSTVADIGVGSTVELVIPKLVFRVTGTVTWQIPKRNSREFPVGIGIQFKDLARIEMGKIGRLVYDHVQTEWKKPPSFEE